MEQDYIDLHNSIVKLYWDIRKTREANKKPDTRAIEYRLKKIIEKSTGITFEECANLLLKSMTDKEKHRRENVYDCPECGGACELENGDECPTCLGDGYITHRED